MTTDLMVCSRTKCIRPTLHPSQLCEVCRPVGPRPSETPRNPPGVGSRWAGPWRLTEVWTSGGLPTDDPATLDEHGGHSELRWVREYDEEPHCERCKPHRYFVSGPVVTER